MNRKALLSVLAAGVLMAGGAGFLIYRLVSENNPGVLPTQAQGDPDPRTIRRQENAPKAASRRPLVQLAPEQQAKVDKAVERGVAYLKSVQNPDGTWTANNGGDDPALQNFPAGVTTLVALTLLECGVNKDDPALQKAVAYLRGRERSDKKLSQTYEVALAVLFFDALNDPQDKELTPRLALRLVGGQRPSGGWSYNCPVFSDADSQGLATLLEMTRKQFRANAQTHKLELEAAAPAQLRLAGGTPPPAALLSLAVWKNSVVVQDDSDNSNTQFAILALWVAKVRGVPVERSLALVVERFHKTQNESGSWGYELPGGRRPDADVSGAPVAMTCAGVLGLAVGQGLVNEARGSAGLARTAAAEDPAIKRALAFLATQVGNPNRPWKDAKDVPLANLYQLWSLERVGVIFGLAKLGGKDWYGWGAERLIAHQAVAGEKAHWPGGRFYGEFPTINTCFALLFLTQANLAKDLTDKLSLVAAPAPRPADRNRPPAKL